MKIYLFKEYNKKGRQTVESHFVTEAIRDRRLEERKAMPMGTCRFETGSFTLPKDIHKLDKFWNYQEVDKLDRQLEEHGNQLNAIKAVIEDIFPKDIL